MSIIRVNVGDVISFGHYPQGSEGQVLPIEWRVLNVRENRALILTQRILDVQPYAGDDGNLFWGNCYLRNWLEQDFTPRAFTQEEMGQIYWPERSEYQENDTLLWQLFGMDDVVENVRDAVFLLSHADVLQYFPGENHMFCPGASAQPTDWVQEQYQLDEACWWLRSSSARNGTVRIVSPVDSIGASWNVQENGQGVRPALWLRLG